MLSPIRKLLIIGATSSLSAQLIPRLLLLEYELDAIVRDRSKSNLNVAQIAWRADLVSSCDNVFNQLPDDLTTYDGCVYMSTTDDTATLSALQQANVPLFLVSSGAVIDYRRGVMPKNTYIEGKLAAESYATTVVYPGFYVVDNLDVRHVGSGLHIDTLKTLFGPHDPAFNYGKPKYVTPVTLLVDIIVKWCATPKVFNGFKGAFGTSSAYTRQEILDGCNVKQNGVYKSHTELTCKAFNVPEPDQLFNEAIATTKKWTIKTLL